MYFHQKISQFLSLCYDSRAKSLTALALLLTFITSSIISCKPGSGEGLDVNGKPLVNNGTPQTEDAYSKVQDIFTARCIACHSGAGAPQGLILDEGLSYDAIVNVDSVQQSDLKLILPNDADSSYLVRKIRGDSGITGTQMPRNGPPFLSQEQISIIVDWVNSGAPRPQPIDPNAEYIASLSDFIGYQSWDAIDYSIGPTNVALGSAHQGDVLTHSRRVYANKKASEKTGEVYPNGSILVKEIVTFENGQKEFAEPAGLLAMVKRGADFNTDFGGWEWFVLSPNLDNVIDRGDNVMEGGCNACHTQARLDQGNDPVFNGSDFVFAHQSEYIAENTGFTTYRDWPVIDVIEGDNPLLDDMAHGAGREGTTRRVYKQQLFANPDSERQGYPIGTTLVKEVSEGNRIIELTAMVKRGGDFNPDNGHWEWFMLDPITAEVMMDNGAPARGANLMNNMCSGCHFSANSQSGNGFDYVFKHGGDPFNNNEEFVAQLADFASYQSWEVVDYTIGDVNSNIGEGHRGLDDAFSRRVFANDKAVQAGNQVFSKGSILVKEITSMQSGTKEFSEQLGLVAMVKRGANFNTNNNGWEWFILSNDNRSILDRGGNLRNDGCNKCHVSAQGDAGKDYVFNHASEFIAQSRDFENYRQWPKIDTRRGTDTALGGAHKGDDTNATRHVYKKQLYATPEDLRFGFPIGTIIVKEVEQNGVITELLAMVKRGANFNNDNQNWEWFMLNPQTAQIEETPEGPARGANLMQGMCNTCHRDARTNNGKGQDYVFFHTDDPVNNQ